jgi:hypothetical protein
MMLRLRLHQFMTYCRKTKQVRRLPLLFAQAEAREVHLSRNDRKVLEQRCRSPATLQRDLKRARIVLLVAASRSTRSIATEVGVQPRIVSLWYADHGLEDLESKPLPGKQPIHTKAC